MRAVLTSVNVRLGNKQLSGLERIFKYIEDPYPCQPLLVNLLSTIIVAYGFPGRYVDFYTLLWPAIFDPVLEN